MKPFDDEVYLRTLDFIDPFGFDYDAGLRFWISENLGLSKNFNVELFKVGRSNLTYKIYDENNTYVFRRPPFSSKLPSAHDMAREYKIISNLYKCGYRVPKPILLCTDKDVSEDDFYIMEYIDGLTLATIEDSESLSSEMKQEISKDYMTTICELHNIEIRNSGLADIGRHEDYIIRQLNRWLKQWDIQKTREIKDLENSTKLLFDSIPEQQRTSIVHGDYRLDNVKVGKDGNIIAVLDWELCTLGDPLADLGTIIASWVSKDEIESPFIYSPNTSGGFLERKALLDIYEEQTGLDLRHIEFYTRFSYWKHALIMEGVFFRYSSGAYGKVNKKRIDLFGESALSFASYSNKKDLLKELL